MTHKENVKKALEEAIFFVDSRGYGGVAHIMHDVLDLLKEQEAVVPVYTTISHPFHIEILYRCGNCHHSLTRDEDLFCRHCGKPIDWTKKAVKWE